MTNTEREKLINARNDAAAALETLISHIEKGHKHPQCVPSIRALWDSLDSIVAIAYGKKEAIKREY